MLRRPPTRVEERADVADEYEFYLQEKERNSSKKSPEQRATRDVSDPAAQREARRQNVRSRIGLAQDQ